MNYIERKKMQLRNLRDEISFTRSFLMRETEIREIQKKFDKYRNCHQGKDFVIVATGPSLKEFKAIDDCIYIGVNKAYKSNLSFSYYFMQDYMAVKGYMEDILSSVKCKCFIGKYVIESDCYSVQVPEQYIRSMQAETYFTSWPLNDILPDISASPFANCGTVTFAAIQFALFCGARRIYLVGCDTSAGGYFDGTKPQNAKSLNWDMLIKNYKKLRSFVELYYPDSEIVSINPVGLKGIFKDVYQ